MNKIVFLFVIACLFVTSCTHKEKTREDRIKEFRSELTQKDTTEMLSLCDNVMEQLKARKIEEVVSSLYEYNDSTREAKPVTDETAKRYVRKFKMFPVLDYHRRNFTFMHEGCNDVKYEVTFASAEQTGTDKPATTMYMFNPVKIDGTWIVCVKTSHDEIAEDFDSHI